MRFVFRFFLPLFFMPFAFFAQNPVCPSPLIYLDGAQFIRVYDPSLPLSANNPTVTNIPVLGGGLTLMPNINGGTLCPTFYSVLNGNYYYWSGSTWVNTGHSAGHSGAVNMGGCNSFIYNLVGSNGQVYVYNGQGNGTLLTTLSGFSGGGPYDLVTDCDCNFYALKTTTLNGQSFTKYSSTGAVVASYSLANMPNTSAGTGLAVVNNSVFVRNGSGFFVGTISGSVLSFTAISGFFPGMSDFASCPSCTTVPTNTFAPAISGATLTCKHSTANISVTTTVSPVSYSWSGPGLTGAGNASVASINSPGVYTCVVKHLVCPLGVVTLTTAVTTSSGSVLAALSPSGNLCVPGNSVTQLVVAHTSTQETVSWSAGGISGSQAGDTLLVASPGTYSVLVQNPINGCWDADSVTIVHTPTVSVALSSPSLCAYPWNGSPASLTITPSGAPGYTLFTSSNYSAPANGTTMPVSILNPGISLGTGTLIGSDAFCTDTAYFSFSVIQNPVITVPPASVCPGLGHTFHASGAATYSWTGNALNTYSGAIVTSSAGATSAYTVVGSESGCESADHITTLTILPIPVFTVVPASSTICLGASVMLQAQGSATDYTWFPAVSLSSSTGISVIASPPGNQKYNVIGALNGCTNIASATVNIVQPPVVSMTISKNAICFNNFNGSANSLSITPSGAQSYTLLAGNNFSVGQANGPVMNIGPAGVPPPGRVVASATLVAVTGVCTVIKTQTFHIIPNPDIGITPASASICPGQSFIFGLTGASSYTWAPSPSLAVLSPNSAIVTPSITSFYAVTGSSLGCNSITKNAVVVVLPVPNVKINPGSTTVCAGNSVSLSVQGSGTNFSWQPPDGLSSVTAQTVSAAPAATRIYTVIATLNTCTRQAVAMVSVIPMPQITATAENSVICSSSGTQLRAVGAMAFSWYPFKDLNSPSGNQVTATPPSSTTYTVWGFNGICSGSTTVHVETVQRPDVTIKTKDGQSVLCYGSSLEIETSGATHYIWTPPQWVTALGSNTLISVNPPVTTNFTLVGANNIGNVYCYQQLNYSVMVIPVIKPVVSPDVTLCLGEKATLSAAGGNTFKWKPSEGLNETTASRVVAGPTVTTVYTVDVSHHTFCNSTSTVLVEVQPRPFVYAGRDTSFHINDPIFISAIGTGTLTWISGDGLRCTDCPETQVYPSRSGCYIAEAVNEYGCLAQDEVCLKISEDFTFYVPNSFTPDGDGLNDVFLVYGENFYNLEMEIYDRWGSRIFSSVDRTQGWDGSVKGEPCKPEVYVYRIKYTGLNRKTYHVTGNVNLIR